MKCDNPPVFRYTWPGEDEKRICMIHALKLNQIADAIGTPVFFHRLTLNEVVDGIGCHQDNRVEG